MSVETPTKNIALFAGGTGGHVFPALAVAEELTLRGYAIHWFGTDRGLEARVIPQANYPLHILRVQGLRGKGLLSRLRAVLAAFMALGQVLRTLRVLRPVCALGMGGYVAGPAGLAARLLRVPLVIHEQNSVAGTTNRWLRHLASKVLVAYPQAFAGAEGTEHVGNPVRREILAAARDYDFCGDRPLRLLVLGGSQGARAINELVPAALRLLPAHCQLLLRHQTGAAHYDAVHLAYEGLHGRDIEILPFIEDMAAAYQWADLVLCRAGALTLAELTIMSRPAILVPLPGAIDNHQTHNAQWLATQGAAVLLPQAQLGAQQLATELAALAAAPTRLAAMAHAARAAASPNATLAVADACEGVQHER